MPDGIALKLEASLGLYLTDPYYQTPLAPTAAQYASNRQAAAQTMKPQAIYAIIRPHFPRLF
ncbi:hypothetical protein A1332_22195 [Methylomonas methanica]|uniref:Uncharacterized protein n=1 Tax=Methylomonas methanica TaxID=421 RepID=A0A177LTW5_METMH|nr:hypothetical protein A1332_22195 [Methylomonas methanica]